MYLRELTPRYFVSPQISAEDVPAVVAAGIATVLCNRPDTEVPPSYQAATVRAAVETAGLQFEELPLTHQTMTPENVDRQRQVIEQAAGPVLAYCASGTRSSVVWALGQAGRMAVDDILACTAAAGYDLDALRPTLELIGRQKT